MFKTIFAFLLIAPFFNSTLTHLNNLSIFTLNPATAGNSQIFLLTPFREGVNQEKNRTPVLIIQSRINETFAGMNDNPVITLSNEVIEIKLLPEVGGRLVSVCLKGHENILNSDPSQWVEPKEKRPTMNPDEPFKAYNGMIVWLSPQSEWWTRQDAYPELKKRRSLWPPDPYLTCSAYRITKQTNHEVVMESPASPHSHVQFTKTFRIEGNRVYITTRARNTSRQPVSWGLWFNTRMNGWDRVLVPADASDLKKTDYYTQSGTRLPAFNYTDGCFSYEPVKNLSGKMAYRSKSYLSVEHPVIMGYKASQWLVIRGLENDLKMIHPEQGKIEIYIENTTNKASDLQELEMHFAYREIAPGESIEATQVWDILEGTGTEKGNDLLRKLK